MKRRPWTWAAATCIVAVLVALPLASTALAGTTTASQEQLRANLSTYLQNVQGALDAAAANPVTRGVVAPQLKHDNAGLAVARSNLSKLNGLQLDALHAILGRDRSWQEQPNAFRQDLSELSTPGPSTPSTQPPGFISDCTDAANLGDPKALFYSDWATQQAASAAAAVNLASPDGDEYAPLLIASAVAFGVTNGLSIGLQDRLSRTVDCITASSNGDLASAFPTLGPFATGTQHSTDLTPASSQIKVDELTTKAGDIDTTLNEIVLVINGTTNKLTDIINNLGLAQGNTDTIQSTAADLQSRTDDLLTSIGSATDQATYTGSVPSGSANGLANTIDTRQDTLLANTASLQTLSIRLQIEESLASDSNPAVALFALPASQGGYLETVRDIVIQTVSNEQAAGQKINGDASDDLAEGIAALNAKNYAQAYKLFAEAYGHAVG